MSDDDNIHAIMVSDSELQLIARGLMDLAETSSAIGRDFDDIITLLTRLAPIIGN